MNEAAFVLAALIGLVLGALGGGGSMLTVPALVYGLSVDPKHAVAMSLPIVGLTSMIGAVSHWRTGDVEPRWALMFGVFAMFGAYGGAKLGVLLPANVQLSVLATVMIAAAVSMLRLNSSLDMETSYSPRHARLSWSASVAVAIGALTGLVGIGGGFLFVPALVLFVHLPMRIAVGTSLVVITMNAVAGLLGYADSISIPWSFVLVFAATASAGALAGTWLARRTPALALQRAFGILLLVIAGGMLLNNVPWVHSAVGAIAAGKPNRDRRRVVQ
jgi:uncharacterized protein